MLGPHSGQALGCSCDRIGCIGGGVVVLGVLWTWMLLLLGKPQFGFWVKLGISSSLILCVCVDVHTPLIKGR